MRCRFTRTYKLCVNRNCRMATKSRFINPCPFCGSDDLARQISNEDREGIPTNIICCECGASGPWIYCSKEELDAEELPGTALKLWNDRSPKKIEIVDVGKLSPSEAEDRVKQENEKNYQV